MTSIKIKLFSFENNALKLLFRITHDVFLNIEFFFYKAIGK